MSEPNQQLNLNFDEDYLKAVDEWKAKYKIREDDSVLLLLDLFRLHQRHWDELRRREFPPLNEFHADVALLAKTVKELPHEHISVTAALMAVIAALLGGYLIGRAF